MIYVGIDPGMKGGISIIEDTNLHPIESIEMPLTADKRAIDVNKVFKMMPARLDHCFCVIEQLLTMPGQNVKATSSSAINYGKLLAVLELVGIPYQEVHPSKWKKEFQLIKKSKYGSAGVAGKLFPTEEFVTERGRLMDGKAESLLLACYARRIYKA